MDSFSCVPHCLHHRAARGLSGSSICLLCVCGSPCLSALVSLSVCGTTRLSKSAFCVFGFVSVCGALRLPAHMQSEVGGSAKFFGYKLIDSEIQTLIFRRGHVVLGQHLLKPWQQTRNEVSSAPQQHFVNTVCASLVIYVADSSRTHFVFSIMLLTFYKPW